MTDLEGEREGVRGRAEKRLSEVKALFSDRGVFSELGEAERERDAEILLYSLDTRLWPLSDKVADKRLGLRGVSKDNLASARGFSLASGLEGGDEDSKLPIGFALDTGTAGVAGSTTTWWLDVFELLVSSVGAPEAASRM